MGAPSRRILADPATSLCPKVHFPTRAAAETFVAEQVANRAKWSHVPRRAYHCPVCDGWHVTSSRTRKGKRP